MGIMGFFAVVNAYTMRISLSVAITEMVIPINSTDYDNPDSCPFPSDHGNNSNAVTVNFSHYVLFNLLFLMFGGVVCFVHVRFGIGVCFVRPSYYCEEFHRWSCFLFAISAERNRGKG